MTPHEDEPIGPGERAFYGSLFGILTCALLGLAVMVLFALYTVVRDGGVPLLVVAIFAAFALAGALVGYRWAP